MWKPTRETAHGRTFVIYSSGMGQEVAFATKSDREEDALEEFNRCCVVPDTDCVVLWRNRAALEDDWVIVRHYAAPADKGGRA